MKNTSAPPTNTHVGNTTNVSDTSSTRATRSGVGKGYTGYLQVLSARLPKRSGLCPTADPHEMKSDITLLRTLLWAQFGFGFIGGAVSEVLGAQLPPEIQELNAYVTGQGSIAENVILYGLLIVLLVSFVGLLLIRPWAKAAYLWSTLGMILMGCFSSEPSTVEPAAYGALADLSAMAGGATLLLLYGTEFGRSWKNLRKQTSDYATA